MSAEVTRTCYPAASGRQNNEARNTEEEYDGRVAAQKEILNEMDTNSRAGIVLLVLMKEGPIQTGRSEKTLKERYLEAVSYGWKTVKEVRLQIPPTQLKVPPKKNVT